MQDHDDNQRSHSERPYVRHNALLLGANLTAGLSGYLLHAVLGRTLGPTAYGTVTALIALSSILLFPTQVLTTAVARFAARLVAQDQRAQLNDLVRRLTLALLPIGILVTLICLGLGPTIGSFLAFPSAQPVTLLAPLFVVAFVAPVTIGAMQGLEQFRAFGAFLVVPVFLRLVIVTFLIALGFGVSGAVLGIVASAVLSYLLSFLPLRGLLQTTRIPSGTLTPFFRFAATTMLALGTTVILYNLDTLLAKHFLAGRQAGLYAGLATVGKTVLVISNSVVMVMFPRFVAIHESGTNPIPALRQSIAAVSALSFIVVVAFCIAPRELLRLLIGPAFVSVGPDLPVYGLAMLIFAVAQVFVYYALACASQACAVIVLGCCLLQMALFSWHHESIESLVLSVLWSKLALLLALAGYYTRYARRQALMRQST